MQVYEKIKSHVYDYFSKVLQHMNKDLLLFFWVEMDCSY